MFYAILLSALFSVQAFSQVKPLKELLLSLSDQELTKAAFNGKTGKCVIVDATNCPQCFCDYYAQTSKAGLAGNGLPHGYGTGCIVAPESPKGVGVCWGAPNVYDKYNNTKTPICGQSMIQNAANMIRIGIQKDLCDLPSTSPIDDQEVTCKETLDKNLKEREKDKVLIGSMAAQIDELKKQLENERAEKEKIKQEKQDKPICESRQKPEIDQSCKIDLDKRIKDQVADKAMLDTLNGQVATLKKQNENERSEKEKIKQEKMVCESRPKPEQDQSCKLDLDKKIKEQVKDKSSLDLLNGQIALLKKQSENDRSENEKNKRDLDIYRRELDTLRMRKPAFRR